MIKVLKQNEIVVKSFGRGNLSHKKEGNLLSFKSQVRLRKLKIIGLYVNEKFR